MTDQDRSEKNALCDVLIKEGIVGRKDEDAINRVSLLTDLAVQLERKDALAYAIDWHEVLKLRGLRDELAIVLDVSHANAIAGDRHSTEWQWEQPTLAREIFYLRRAVAHANFNQLSGIVQCQILNNLGNRLRVAGRLIESLDYWRRVLDVQPNFGMALCNRAMHLVNYGMALEDTGKRALFLWMAHKEASAALAATALYTDPQDDCTREAVKALKAQIESTVDIKGVTSLDPLKWEDTLSCGEERQYRH